MKKTRQLLSIFLCIALLLGNLPATGVFATGADSGMTEIVQRETEADVPGTSEDVPAEIPEETVIPSELPGESPADVPAQEPSDAPEETLPAVPQESPETVPAQDGTETSVQDPDAPETEAPVTEAPETEAPETEVPAAEAPETEAPEEETASPEDYPDVPRPAFSASADVDGFTITLTSPAGVFPEGSSLFAQKVTVEQQAKVEGSIEELRAENKNVAASYTFDIRVLGPDGREIQPADDSVVKVAFAVKEASNTNLDAAVYHTDHDLNTEELPIAQTAEEEVVVETGSFSFYTVEFTYDARQYVLTGNGEILLTDLLDDLGLTGEIDAWEVSSPDLFDVFLGDEYGIAYEYESEELRAMEAYGIPANKEGGLLPWLVSRKPFQSEEWLKITLDGIEYRIDVTDTYIDDYGNDLSDRVVQDGDLSHFTQSMPLADIFIDEAVVNMVLYKTSDLNSRVTPRLLTDNEDFLLDTTSSGEEYAQFNYKGTIVSGQDNFFEGPLVEYRLAGAARYTDDAGNEHSADIVITYSNLHLVLQNNSSSYTPDNYVRLIDTNRIYPALEVGAPSRMGMKVDANIKVVDPNNGDALVPGTFIYPMTDIDIDRTTGGGSANFGRLYDAGNNRNYSEQVEIKGGYVGKIWIPEDDTTGVVNERDGFISGVTQDSETGNILVYPKLSDNTNSFVTGFITLGDNTAGGISITSTSSAAIPTAAHGNYASGMESYLITGGTRVNLRVAESSDEGGWISASSKDYDENITPPVLDGERQYNEKKIITVALAQTVVFTMTPDPGWRIKNVYVSGTDLNILENHESVGPIPLDHPNMRALPNGVYEYTMHGITNNQSIHVEWEPTVLEVKKDVIDPAPGSSTDFRFRLEVMPPTTESSYTAVVTPKQPYLTSVTLPTATWDDATGWDTDILNDWYGKPLLIYDSVNNNFIGYDGDWLEGQPREYFTLEILEKLLKGEPSEADGYLWSTNLINDPDGAAPGIFNHAGEIMVFPPRIGNPPISFSPADEIPPSNGTAYIWSIPLDIGTTISYPTFRHNSGGGYNYITSYGNIYQGYSAFNYYAVRERDLQSIRLDVTDCGGDEAAIRAKIEAELAARYINYTDYTYDIIEKSYNTGEIDDLVDAWNERQDAGAPTLTRTASGEYEFTLTYTEGQPIPSVSFDRVVPHGWKYRVTELDQNNNSVPLGGNLIVDDNDWTLESIEGEDAGTMAFEDPSVTFSNKSEKHSITVIKQTQNGKAGTFRYQIKAWKEGETPQYFDFTSQGAAAVTGGAYEFTLTTPDGSAVSKTFEGIPVGYQYEIREFIEGRWELVSVKKEAPTDYVIRGGKKYKVVIEDYDLEAEANVVKAQQIKVYFKSYTGTDGIETVEVIASSAADAALLSQYFDTFASTLEDGGTAVAPSDVSVDTSTSRTNVSYVLRDTDGNTYNVVKAPVSKSEYLEDEHLAIADLSTITPVIQINGHTVPNHGGQQGGDHFQNQTDSATQNNTYMRLRYGSDGNVSQFTPSNHTVSYSDVITYTYPNAATLPDGTEADVVITVSDISITVPDNARSVNNNAKYAIFMSTGGPNVAAWIIGTAQPASYTVQETVKVKVPGADGLPFTVDFDGTTYTNEEGDTVTFTATAQGVKANPVHKPIVPAGYDVHEHELTLTSSPSTITVERPDDDPNIHKDDNGTPEDASDDFYIVELEPNQSVTIPDGVTYTIYEDDGEGGWTLVKDSAASSSTSTDNPVVTGKLENKDVTVTYTNRLKPLVVQKTWVDEDNAYVTRPEDLAITVVTEKAGDTPTDVTRTQDDAVIEKDGNVWTYTFDADADETWKSESVTETVPDAYEETKNALNEETGVWELENTVKKNDLTVTKTTDLPTSETFSFRVKIWKEVPGEEDATVTLDFLEDAGLTAGENEGEYVFTLKNGESRTFSDIPYGFQWEVWEVDASGARAAAGGSVSDYWKLRSETDTSGTAEGEDQSSAFVNEVKRGTVNVLKETVNDAPGTFPFKIRLVSPYVPGDEPEPVPNKARVTKRFETSVQNGWFDTGFDFTDMTISSWDGDPFVLTLCEDGVPVETGSPLGEDGWTYNGQIFTDSEYYTDITEWTYTFDWELDPAKAYTVREPAYAALTFTNRATYLIYADAEAEEKPLEDDNTVTFTNPATYIEAEPDGGGSGDEGGEFGGSQSSAAKAPALRGGRAAGVSFDTIAVDENLVEGTDNTWEYEFTLENGEDIDFTDIPFGVTYEVWEETPNGWKLVSVDGDTAKTRGEGTVESEDPYEHVFLNLKLLSLTVTKEITGNMGDKEDVFDFTVQLTKAGAVEEVTAYYALNAQTPVDPADPATYDASVTLTVAADGTVSMPAKLGHRGMLLITGLPYGCGYTVEEIEADTGYTAITSITGDSLTNDGQATEASIEIGRGVRVITDSFFKEDSQIDYVNKRVAAVPTEIRFTWFSGLILLLIAAAYFFFRFRRVPAQAHGPKGRCRGRHARHF